MFFLTERCIIRASQSFVRRYLCSIPNSYLSNENAAEITNTAIETVPQSNERKVLSIAIIGRPNAGKSTLVNNLIKRTVCPTSSKVHTTEHNALAIYNEGNTQLIFTDTPGLVVAYDLKKYTFKESVIQDQQKSTCGVDVVGLIQDASNSYTRHYIHDSIIEQLLKIDKQIPLILILNKVDLIKTKEVLLKVTRALTSNKGYPTFCDVFMISALNSDGIDDLRQYFLDMAKPGEWKYPEEKCSNQKPETLIEETVRAKLMDALVNEISYQLVVKTQYCAFREDGSIIGFVDVLCKNERHKKLLLRGKKLKNVCFMIEEELRGAFRANVSIKVNVSHKAKPIPLNE